LLDRQNRNQVSGDLLELGAYLGKSTILIGHYQRPGDQFTVCDLFGQDAPDAANQAETMGSYATLTRATFERNYLAFHRVLPAILQAPTSSGPAHVSAHSCRFVHVDASHLYEHVHGDIEMSRRLLNDDGLIVCDDYRSAHTPGVAAAVWEAVLSGNLRPICLTANKFYGTWREVGAVQQDLLDWFAACGLTTVDQQHVAGHRVVRIDQWHDPPRPRFSSVFAAGTIGSSPTPAGVWLRRVARDLLPPLLTRKIRNARARR
jgi:hypothetical protein